MSPIYGQAGFVKQYKVTKKIAQKQGGQNYGKKLHSSSPQAWSKEKSWSIAQDQLADQKMIIQVSQASNSRKNLARELSAMWH